MTELRKSMEGRQISSAERGKLAETKLAPRLLGRYSIEETPEEFVILRGIADLIYNLFDFEDSAARKETVLWAIEQVEQHLVLAKEALAQGT